MSLGSLVTAIGAASTSRIAGAYFRISYRLLATPAGRELGRAAAAPGSPAVHGYATSEDVEALLEAIRPSPEHVLVDLGCGFGEVAIAIHQRTGCRVVGLDAAPEAVVEARRRALAARVGEAVRFQVTDLRSRSVRGSAGYALDSLMFVPRPPEVLARLSRSLDPPGRIFVTFVDHRWLTGESFAQFIGSGGVRLERLEDVSSQFEVRSRERAATARRLLRDRPPWSGRLALWLVVWEEAAVARLIRRGRLRRWRVLVTAWPVDAR